MNISKVNLLWGFGLLLVLAQAVSTTDQEPSQVNDDQPIARDERGGGRFTGFFDRDGRGGGRFTGLDREGRGGGRFSGVMARSERGGGRFRGMPREGRSGFSRGASKTAGDSGWWRSRGYGLGRVGRQSDSDDQQLPDENQEPEQGVQKRGFVRNRPRD